MNLKEQSIKIIKNNQHASGAFIASPSFPNYQFCWLRDGTFIAYALDRVGEHISAGNFYRWVHERIQEQSASIQKLEQKVKNGDKIKLNDLLPTRYTLEGQVHDDDWPNYQIDGYGTWLWGLVEHCRLTGDYSIIQEFYKSIAYTVKYLSLSWQLPNYDCWEENGEYIHPSTLACLYGGIKAVGDLLDNSTWLSLAENIKNYVLKNAVYEGRLVKYLGSQSVDASLLWVATPFKLLSCTDPVMIKTVTLIEKRLLHGGVHRYPEDTYYGGGEWLLLTAWLGWYYCQVSRNEEARKLLSWVENQADDKGEMPEQVCDHPNDAAYYPQWVQKWGPVAKPLLWSHAMYLILLEELNNR